MCRKNSFGAGRKDKKITAPRWNAGRKEIDYKGTDAMKQKRKKIKLSAAEIAFKRAVIQNFQKAKKLKLNISYK